MLAWARTQLLLSARAWLHRRPAPRFQRRSIL